MRNLRLNLIYLSFFVQYMNIFIHRTIQARNCEANVVSALPPLLVENKTFRVNIIIPVLNTVQECLLLYRTCAVST